MKNETVIGIIGKTQGVKMAASPSPKAVRRNVARLPFAEAGVAGLAGFGLLTCAATAPGLISVYPAGTTKAAATGAAGSTFNVKTAVFLRGGRHWRSLHA